MSKRLQVLLDEAELQEIRRVARAQKMTISEWVRTTLRRASSNEPSGDVRKKIEVVRAAVRHSYPTGDIDQMIAEVEHGYGGGDRP